MELYNEKYLVLSKMETTPPLNSFDIVYNTEKVNTIDFYSAHVFQVKRYDGHVISIALLDLICSGCEPYAVLSGNTLTVILFSAIMQLNLDNGLITRYVECDNMGGLFEIHQISNGYIIYGEGNIFRYDLELNRIWSFSGRDIFVSQTGVKSFWIGNELIHCIDWEGWHYVLDFDGKLTRETRIAETL